MDNTFEIKRPNLVESDFLLSLEPKNNLMNIDNLGIEVPNIDILKTKKSRSILVNWIVLFIILFIIYLLYQRFINIESTPNLESLPESIKNNKYHKDLENKKKKKLTNSNNSVDYVSF